jgi:hypothetical protein
MTLENIMALAKEAKPDTDWLKQAKSLKEIAIDARQPKQRFEKLPRLDLRLQGGSESDPLTVVVKAVGTRREVKTENMRAPMTVFDAELVFCSNRSVKAGKYSIWENTTVLHNEMMDYANAYGVNGDITGKTFIIAYYGTVPSSKNKAINIHIFRVIPHESAA